MGSIPFMAGAAAAQANQLLGLRKLPARWDRLMPICKRSFDLAPRDVFSLETLAAQCLVTPAQSMSESKGICFRNATISDKVSHFGDPVERGQSGQGGTRVKRINGLAACE